MSRNIGFQFGLEVTKVLPVKEAAENVTTRLLNIARNLRKSGSDLVVEEDLAELLGRAHLEPAFEKEFRNDVKAQNTQELPGVAKVFLAQGASPTVLNALQDKRSLSALAQLYPHALWMGSAWLVGELIASADHCYVLLTDGRRLPQCLLTI